MKQSSMEYHSRLKDLLNRDADRMDLLRLVEKSSHGYAWIGGGFIRHMVWDAILGKGKWKLNDIDVLYLGSGGRSEEERLFQQLQTERPDVNWSVKDQVRMAHKHGHETYRSIERAIYYWVEKCTAVAVRMDRKNIEIAAPYGLSELFEGIISPTTPEMQDIMNLRARDKGWIEHYPFLRIYT